MILSAITFVSFTWYSALEKNELNSSDIAQALQITQNICLRRICDDFWAISTRALERITQILSLTFTTATRAATHRLWCQNTRMNQMITAACEKIQWHLYISLRRYRATIEAIKHEKSLSINWFENWIQTSVNIVSQNIMSSEQSLRSDKRIRRALMNHWRRTCSSDFKRLWLRTARKKMIWIHTRLHKVQISILTQIWTRKIDLTIFLHKMQVSKYSSSICSCEQALETSSHVTIYCLRFRQARVEILINDAINYRTLLSTIEEAYQLMSWWLQIRRLSQFHLTTELLQEQLWIEEWKWCFDELKKRNSQRHHAESNFSVQARLHALTKLDRKDKNYKETHRHVYRKHRIFAWF